jgi:phosphoribosylamine---glycine ligase
MASGRRVLVVGSGGREHALALRLAVSPSVDEVWVAPGNPGTAQLGRVRNLEGTPIELAERERPDLVVIGPEAPLVAGLVDELETRGIRAFGPSRLAARLEGSKAFMKDFAKRHGIPTARHVVVTDSGELDAAIGSFETPPVVKADGLCAGKGVVVPDSVREATEAARAMLSDGVFGAAGRTLVLEERLMGAEASVHAICDGQRAIVLPAARDHKRIGDGDTGPNTGGMGTYAPAPLVTPELSARIEREIIAPTLRGMAEEGAAFRGALFAGLMITPRGEPRLLEFNVRFGDPETQVLMNVIDGDFAEALDRAARGALEPSLLRPAPRHAVCVVLAAAGYPGRPRGGDVIRGLEQTEQLEGVVVYHAGTRQDGDRIVTAGGRVLGITAIGATLAEAHARAYAAVALVRFDGCQLRSDIAAHAP